VPSIVTAVTAVERDAPRVAPRKYSIPPGIGLAPVIALIVVVGNLLVDLLYAVVDPRTAAADRPGRTKEIAAGVM
jgi:hypothetical protein